jgi:hypothetical protein
MDNCHFWERERGSGGSEERNGGESREREEDRSGGSGCPAWILGELGQPVVIGGKLYLRDRTGTLCCATT